ncbi:MAG TPA: CDP-alcohol phosphatidyltransferase family protein [Thermoanaerobaculia bacterium]|nr:CDP-alcohol phosphatidyltransferase family protein [Thermoanaerobaculia bacterium]
MNVWRDRLHRWFEPLARRCPLSPNAITILALALNAVAAALLWGRAFAAGVVLLIVGGLADAFDGIVARVQRKESRFGDFLDHFADRVSDLLLVTGWLLGNGVRVEISVLAIIGVALNGYIGTQLEATWGERRYDTMGRGEYVLALVVYPIVSIILFDNGWQLLAWRGLTIADALAMLLVLFAWLGIVQRFLQAVRMERG